MASVCHLVATPDQTEANVPPTAVSTRAEEIGSSASEPARCPRNWRRLFKGPPIAGILSVGIQQHEMVRPPADLDRGKGLSVPCPFPSAPKTGAETASPIEPVNIERKARLDGVLRAYSS